MILEDYLFYHEEFVDIYCGDVHDIMPLLSTDLVDTVVTDTPYGVGIDYGKFVDTFDNVKELLSFFLPEAIRISSGAVLFPSGRFPTELYLYQNYPPKWRICWYKGAQSTLSAIGYCDWEMILVYGKKIHRNVHDHFYAQPESMGMWGHPCPKPIEWATWIISKFCGNTVLDPFMGSGTTCVSAKSLHKKAIGIDIEAKNCEIAVKRLKGEIIYKTSTGILVGKKEEW